MMDLKQLLTPAVRHNGSRYTQRMLVVLNNARCYNRCLRFLHELGVRPAKKLAYCNAVCCHIHREADLNQLRRHPMIKRIEPDLKVKSTNQASFLKSSMTGMSIPWGIRKVKAPQIWKVTEGNGIGVAVLDTGISKHPDLRPAKIANMLSKKRGIDYNGHGTHVAGTLAALKNTYGVVGVAPKVKLYSVKVLDKNGEGFISDLIAGLEWCTRNHVRVVNMSLGMSEKSETLHEAVKKAYVHGIVIVAPAGNDGPHNEQIDYPGRFPETISVAAATRKGKIASYSSRGRGIDVSAPGDNVRSTYLRNKYNKLDGTSMAVPHVTGAAALLMAVAPRLHPQTVKTILRRTSTRLKGYTEEQQGAGLINVRRAVQHVLRSGIK
jgi:minor extracellular protease Epr